MGREGMHWRKYTVAALVPYLIAYTA
jgi:Protein of unknown function (DUF4246)